MKKILLILSMLVLAGCKKDVSRPIEELTYYKPVEVSPVKLTDNKMSEEKVKKLKEENYPEWVRLQVFLLDDESFKIREEASRSLKRENYDEFIKYIDFNKLSLEQRQRLKAIEKSQFSPFDPRFFQGVPENFNLQGRLIPLYIEDSTKELDDITCIYYLN